nr:unknown [Zea mays]
MKGDNQPKTSRGDNRGMAVVVLDALTRRPWVREEDLAKALKLHSKQLRRILRFFEEEKLVTRDHRKESAKNAKAHNAAAANDGQPIAKEGEEKVKLHTHSYCCLDYAQEQLKPLVAQLDRVKNIPAPEFGSLQTWERANIGAFAIGDPAAADSSRNSQGQYGTPMPYIGETKVEVDLLSDGVKEGAESGKTDSELKVLPPWMIKDGMNLTKEQRGEIIAPQKLEKSDAKDDKKHDLKDDHSVQEEYIKAYYEALRKKQEEEEAKRRMQQEGKVFLPDFQTERQVGKKYKRDGDDEGIEWEEHQPTGYATETYKLADLNAEAQESGDDEDDNVWEEG